MPSASRQPSRFDHELSQTLQQLDRGECVGALHSLLRANQHIGKTNPRKDERNSRIRKQFLEQCVLRRR